ncbi:GMC family oxidoreductase [Paenibacillus albiflavus]|nr:GMC family oxidoreductase [Paenibacillus albiflavus]
MMKLDWRYQHQEVDVVIVGAGAAGGVLAQELSDAGLSVVILEAGPLRSTQKDLASDELAMQSLGWQETRIVSGDDPLTMGHNNSGYGVGGGTVHFTGVFLRFHESDFKTRSIDGVGEDWPIHYKDLEPYYNRIERDIGVAGPRHFPWGNYHGPYPLPEREALSPNAEMFRIGCSKLNIQTVVTPLAIVTAPFKGRPPCINRGFCNQGCMPTSKFTTLTVHIPKAMESGAVLLADCMATQILMKDDLASGVLFMHQGVEYRQRAKLVIVCAFAVETPRLLLNSETSRYPEGLANSSGWVGRGIMPHSSYDVYAKFDYEVRLYKGTPVLSSTQDFYATDRSRGFARGYTLHAHGSRPLEFAKGIAGGASNGAPLWGKMLRETMLDYNYYGRITMVGEVLPYAGNRVTLSEEKDPFGLPRAHVSFSYGDNDLRLIDHAVDQMSAILRAASGKVEHIVSDTAHLMGGCRMGNDPEESVVNSFCQSHDVPNLFICDASVFVTSSGVNPTNTIMAIAARTADYIIDKASKNELK